MRPAARRRGSPALRGSRSVTSTSAARLVWVAPHATPWSNSSRCPDDIGGVTSLNCGWFDVVDDEGRAWNATRVVLDGLTLALAAPVVPPRAGARAIGTRFGWAELPVVNVYDEAGFPLTPWARNETSGAYDR